MIGQLSNRSSVGVMCHRYPPLSLSFIRVTLGSGASPARFVAVLQFVGSFVLEPFVRLLVVAAAAARCCCGLRLFDLNAQVRAHVLMCSALVGAAAALLGARCAAHARGARTLAAAYALTVRSSGSSRVALSIETQRRVA